MVWHEQKISKAQKQKVQTQRLVDVDFEIKDTKSKEDYAVYCCVTPDKLTTGKSKFEFFEENFKIISWKIFLLRQIK